MQRIDAVNRGDCISVLDRLVVSDALVPAAVAPLDVAAQRRRATEFDRAHGSALCGREGCPVVLTIGLTIAAEYIRHFRPLAGHGSGRSGRCRSGTTTARYLRLATSKVCATVSPLDVLQATSLAPTG